MIDASLLVVGAGAIGGVTAARMTGAVRRVTVLETNREHARIMRDQGLLLDELGSERLVRIDARTALADLDGEFDFALLTLKAPHLEAALGPLHERNLAATYVSLGNGLVQDRITRVVGTEHLIAGTVEWGATNLGPGRLAQTTRAPFVIGELDGAVRPRTRLLAQALGTVAEVRVTDNIRGQIWSKLLVNSTFSGLGVVAGLLYREIAADPTGRAVAYALWREGVTVARAEGASLDEVLGVPAGDLVVRGPEDLRRADRALEVMMSYGGATKASMLQDIERGAVTEVDVINGAVVERGLAHGIPAPLNTHIVELVHAMERGEARPSPALFADLYALAR